MESTIQLAPTSDTTFGTGIKIVPMTDEQQTNVKTCFWINGTEEAPLAIQSVLPDTSDFTLIGQVDWKGVQADQWQTITQEGDKKNTYTFYVSSSTGEPLHYEMIGYDSLLGSHYDRYYIDYHGYSTDPISADTFAIKTSKQELSIQIIITK